MLRLTSKGVLENRFRTLLWALPTAVPPLFDARPPPPMPSGDQSGIRHWEYTMCVVWPTGCWILKSREGGEGSRGRAPVPPICLTPHPGRRKVVPFLAWVFHLSLVVQLSFHLFCFRFTCFAFVSPVLLAFHLFCFRFTGFAFVSPVLLSFHLFCSRFTCFAFVSLDLLSFHSFTSTIRQRSWSHHQTHLNRVSCFWLISSPFLLVFHFIVFAARFH
jgi:hypothetical protein